MNDAAIFSSTTSGLDQALIKHGNVFALLMMLLNSLNTKKNLFDYFLFIEDATGLLS